MNATMYHCNYVPERDKPHGVAEPTARVEYIPPKEGSLRNVEESVWLRFEEGSFLATSEIIVMMTRAQFLAYAAKVAAAVQSLASQQEPK